jgi:tetratricopeptide (TPR) repeat protein
MHGADARWEKRIAGLWAEFDAYREDDFLSRIEGLVAELPPGNAVGLFEHGSAFDTVGHSERAVPLYAAALGAGLEGERRRRAVIQMASSLRNLGKSQEAVELLTAEMNVASDDLDGAVATFLALALVDVGREREAVAVAVTALSKYLPRYNRSAARYAMELTAS